MLLFIVRHGDPIYDPDSLTELGKKQAEALAPRFALHGLDRIYTSPKIRAQDTAAPTARALGLTPTVEEWTSEDLAYEDFSMIYPDGHRGWTFRQNPVHYMENGNAFDADWYDNPAFPGQAEKMKRGYERITRESDAFLSRLGYEKEGRHYRIVRPNDERIAVFCHEGFGTIWLSVLLGLPPQVMWADIGFSHTGVTALEFFNDPEGVTMPRMLCASDLSHIFAAGLPYRFYNRLDL